MNKGGNPTGSNQHQVKESNRSHGETGSTPTLSDMGISKPCPAGCLNCHYVVTNPGREA